MGRVIGLTVVSLCFSVLPDENLQFLHCHSAVKTMIMFHNVDR